MNFGKTFEILTGKPPFPWQERLYQDYFSSGKIPASCTLPTGLGKTNVIAVWLAAIIHEKPIPRRLVYVVNRRTVVDQTTTEAELFQQAINESSVFAGFRTKYEHLRISTLRGSFADNGDWCEDPSKPAIICGTVDMIGSRLLFSGYGIGRNKRPLHAGFLGTDTLLVHDEAHLEPAFQKLVTSIRYQQRSLEPDSRWPKLEVMELTATSKSTDSFTLNDDDLSNPIVHERFHAKKALHLHQLVDAKKPGKELLAKALSYAHTGKGVLIFVQSIEAVMEIQHGLEKNKIPRDNIRTLTGTMRGMERDKLTEDETFKRFLPNPPDDATEGTVFLACTSAGEVGVNISADHLICDLSTFESMAQRFGRVNRFGKFDDCEIHVFHPNESAWDEKSSLTTPRKNTLQLLIQTSAQGSASPYALSLLDATERTQAFAPEPDILPTTDMLFDAWALTTIRESLPGRPAVEPWLHGVSEEEPSETQFAWRLDVSLLEYAQVSDENRTELLEVYPLLPCELLREPSHRAIKHLEAMAKRSSDHSVWLVEPDGRVISEKLSYFLNKENKESIFGRTVVLDPIVGGLNATGMLDASIVEYATDVSKTHDRCRESELDPSNRDLHEVFSLEIASAEEDEPLVLRWFALKNFGEVKSKLPVGWEVHVSDVENRVQSILSRLSLGDSLNRCLLIAARYHDHGKKRKLFQTMLGNRNSPDVWWAKSGSLRGVGVLEKYRHEFGSIRELPSASELEIGDDERELVLHLIASHHGRARPHFPIEEVFDPESTQATANAIALKVPSRFARLQRRFGRWGLAYLESILRAADWSASANPSRFETSIKR
jgi:CRISPR-associated endonuclease/helicase Cas3